MEVKPPKIDSELASSQQSVIQKSRTAVAASHIRNEIDKLNYKSMFLHYSLVALSQSGALGLQPALTLVAGSGHPCGAVQQALRRAPSPQQQRLTSQLLLPEPSSFIPVCRRPVAENIRVTSDAWSEDA
eukprot:5318507-Pleurochrysis_carterae.AAC.2